MSRSPANFFALESNIQTDRHPRNRIDVFG